MSVRERGIGGWWLAALVGAALVSGAAGAQEQVKPDQNPDEALTPPPRPVSIYLTDSPTISVVFNGDQGASRVTGTLETAPMDLLHLTDVTGHSRDAAWTDVRDLALVRSASEGFPLGSFTVTLLSDPGTQSSNTGFTGGYLSPALSSPGVGQVGWRLPSLNEGQLTLRGQNFGQLDIPVSRIVSVSQEPIRGGLVALPQGTVRVEVLPGKTVDVSLADVVSLRRNPRAETISLTLADGQRFSGKLVSLPQVSITLGEGRDRRTLPLNRIVEIEFTAPTLGGTGAFGTDLGLGPSGTRPGL